MNAKDLPLNRPITVARTDVFRGTISRISKEILEMVYYHQPTNDQILKMQAYMDDGSGQLVFFDKAYWALSINGRPATEGDLRDLKLKSNLRIVANPVARRLDVQIVT